MTVCRGARCGVVQPAPASVQALQALQALHISVQGYEALTLTLLINSSLVAFT